MTVKFLRLRNFRNYALQEAGFSDKLNILYGENAQGKTNILEAIFLCSTGRSHRTQKDAELIKFGEDAAVVELEMEREHYGVFKIEIEIKKNGRKSIVINGVPQRRAGDLLGRLNCAMFSPEDLGIIKDEPQIRRRFLDMFISQIKPAYYFNLQRYLGALRQRNALLKQAKENPRLLDSIGAWDSQLAGLGSKVMRERIYFLDLISEAAKTNYAQITNGREELAVAYDPSVKIGAYDPPAKIDAYDPPVKIGAYDPPAKIDACDPSAKIDAYDPPAKIDASGISGRGKNHMEEHIAGAFAEALESGLRADVARAATQYGPHKDDIACAVDGRNLRLYGSQGQQRTAALALKMAQVDVMALETGDVPVLLLDDVMSELDSGRRENLSVNMKAAQTFITGTERYAPATRDAPNMPGAAAYFLINAGQITSEHV